MLLFLLDAPNEGEVDDLRKVAKGIATLVGVKVVDVDQAVFHPVADHVVTKGIVDEIGFIRQMGRDLQKALAHVVRNGRRVLAGFDTGMAGYPPLAETGQELLIIDVVFGFAFQNAYPFRGPCPANLRNAYSIA